MSNLLGAKTLRILAAAWLLTAGLVGRSLADPGGSWLEKAVALYNQRGERPQAATEALAAYQQALAEQPGLYEALWQAARCCWWLGDHARPGERMTRFEAGVTFARQAQQAAPKETKGYYWEGVCLGRAAEERGVLNSLFAVDGIAGAMEKVLALDSQDGYAHHVLGVLYRKAPGWPLSRGNLAKALEHGRAAVALEPQAVLPAVGLAEIHIAMGKKDEARMLLEKALTLPGAPDMQPETKNDQALARRILEKL